VLSSTEAVRAIDLVSAALAAVKEGSDPRIQLELALLKSAAPRSDLSIEALLARIEQLERSAGLGGDPAPEGAARSSARRAASTPAPSAREQGAAPAASASAEPAPEQEPIGGEAP